MIGCVDSPAGGWEDFGNPGGRGATGRGSSGPTGIFTGGTVSTCAGFTGMGGVGAGDGAGLDSGTGTSIGGVIGGGGAKGGATGAVATPAVPAGAAGGDTGCD